LIVLKYFYQLAALISSKRNKRREIDGFRKKWERFTRENSLIISKESLEIK
jgi:hypothetical protein